MNIELEVVDERGDVADYDCKINQPLALRVAALLQE